VALARVGEGAGQEAGINRNGEMSVFSWPLRPAEKPGKKWNSSWLQPPNGHENALLSSLSEGSRKGETAKKTPHLALHVVRVAYSS